MYNKELNNNISDKEYLYNNQKDFSKHSNDKLSNVEEKYFKVLNENMINNSLQRIESTKLRIKNDITKGCYNKKYQIKSHIEYNLTKRYCEEIVPDYNLNLCYDLNVKTNVLDKIYRGHFFCCKECDIPITFINKQTNVLYCHLSKK
jgi:hypothetical protein